MKLKMSNKTSARQVARLTKKIRIRRKITGTSDRPRLCVFRSAKHIYAQVFDDVSGKCLVQASSLSLNEKSGKEQAAEVGKEISKLAKSKGINQVVFDRNGFVFHGRVKALADGAREGGLSF